MADTNDKGAEEVEMNARTRAQVIQNGYRLSALYGAHAPGQPQRTTSADLFCMACLARAHYSLQTILNLQHRSVDSITLARSVYEHVVTFAWVAIDPVTHYPMFLEWEKNQRIRMMNDLRPFADGVPSDSEIARVMIDASGKAAPETADRALAATKYWSRLHPTWEWRFRHGYANFFRYCSVYVHPTNMGLECFVTHEPEGSRVGIPLDRRFASAIVFAIGAFADGLLVASLRFGWPPEREVLKALTAGVVQFGDLE